MDNTSIFGFMDIVIFAGGLYVLYAWWLLKTKGEIKQGILVSKDVDPKRCKDPEGYRSYMGPRTLIFGIATVAAGAIGLYQDFVKKIPAMFYGVCFCVFMICVIWYAAAGRSAQKKFW